MPDRVLVAATMTDNGHEIEVEIDHTSGYLTSETIRNVVWAAPRAELRALERLWLFARNVVLSPYDFLPQHIDAERGRNDVARAWLRLDAARRRSREAELVATTAAKEGPA